MLVLADCHVHLDDPLLSAFMESLGNMESSGLSFLLISNSADVKSSATTVDLARKHRQVAAFVGIHPQIFVSKDWSRTNAEAIDRAVQEIDGMLSDSSGVGEIGLDPKYGQLETQELLFTKQLELAEKAQKPVSLHSRDSAERIFSVLPSFRIGARAVLMHWFAGTESEFEVASQRGYYMSFSLPCLTSKKVARFVANSDATRLLAETDSPLTFPSVSPYSPVTPFMVGSVIFAMSQSRNADFAETIQTIETNARCFLSH